MFAKKVVFLATLLMLVAQQSLAIYEKDKGKNEWYIETLGEIRDLIFIGEGQSYTLSTDHLLTLFDVNSQTIVWKKQMAESQGGYRLRHIGRNLIIYSDERVAMVNSVGHVIFEVPLLGESSTVLEIFQEKNGDIFTIMVRDKLVTVYNGYVSAGSFLIQTDAIPDVDTFMPLQIIYSASEGKLVLLAEIAQTETKKTMAMFNIDYKAYESAFIG